MRSKLPRAAITNRGHYRCLIEIRIYVSTVAAVDCRWVKIKKEWFITRQWIVTMITAINQRFAVEVTVSTFLIIEFGTVDPISMARTCWFTIKAQTRDIFIDLWTFDVAFFANLGPINRPSIQHYTFSSKWGVCWLQDDVHRAACRFRRIFRIVRRMEPVGKSHSRWQPCPRRSVSLPSCVPT